ncbi:interferon-induced protein with tetratricopeptide repeats 1-like [Chanos chanos]|uniref:Interferon-induced protein with tetratricopeptide repeats 1-like n=1 Tax=Chanos chanos TaxID=29144 RepID=A0A6J2WHX6_CHACN|nr:interferon-induced protein with tetratricopeptide repeats 1-like [Chanos chanos]
MEPGRSFLNKQLERLECHFTWNLDNSPTKLDQLWEHLEEKIQEECSWLGHLYNLLGYVHHARGYTKEALSYLKRAEGMIREQGPTELYSRLLVNQTNLAWVHYCRGELTESQTYLEKVQKLQQASPPPPECNLHPEVSGEKGWTLVKFGKSYRHRAIECFEMALKGEPERKEWHKGLAIAMSGAYLKSEITPELQTKILEQIKKARDKNPDCLYMVSLYLVKLPLCQSSVPEAIVKEALSLVDRMSINWEGLSNILEFLRRKVSLDSALDVAQRALKKFPQSSGVKKQVAICYKWKIFSIKENSTKKQNLISKAVDFYEEVIGSYPHYLRGKLDLATMYSLSGNEQRADQIYSDLFLKTDSLEPRALQLLYSRYGSHLNWLKRSSDESIDYHKKAAEIPALSEDRENSIRILNSIVQRGQHHKCEEIRNFLENLRAHEDNKLTSQ